CPDFGRSLTGPVAPMRPLAVVFWPEKRLRPSGLSRSALLCSRCERNGLICSELLELFSPLLNEPTPSVALAPFCPLALGPMRSLASTPTLALPVGGLDTF